MMMVNREFLEDAIKKNGLKKSFIASKLGITSRTFSNKLKGKTSFKEKEIEILCELLNVKSLKI